MKSRFTFCFLPVLIMLVFASCSSSEIGLSKDVSQDKICQQYRIRYTEGSSTAEVFAQFRFAGPKGTTLVLSAPSAVTFNGEKLTVDSTSFMGAFYKSDLKVGGLETSQQFCFTDINGKKYTNQSRLQGVKLIGLPDEIDRNKPLPITFQTALLAPDDYIMITAVNTDSTFSIIHYGREAGQEIIIPATQLQRQKSNVLTLVPSVYRSSVLKEQNEAGGSLDITINANQIRIPFKP